MLVVIIVLGIYALRRRKAYFELDEANRQLIHQLDQMHGESDANKQHPCQ